MDAKNKADTSVSDSLPKSSGCSVSVDVMSVYDVRAIEAQNPTKMLVGLIFQLRGMPKGVGEPKPTHDTWWDI